jgi:hypothetical protein
MRVMKTMTGIVSVVLSLAVGQAAAMDLTDKTPCAAMVKAFDSNDPARVVSFATYALNKMDELDSNHTRRGEPGIMAQLSDDGRSSMVAITSVNCRKYPKMTIYNSAAFVYTGMREMQMQLGTAK